jgi:hypothetical protein
MKLTRFLKNDSQKLTQRYKILRETQPTQNRAEGMAEVVEHLPSKRDTLSSNYSTKSIFFQYSWHYDIKNREFWNRTKQSLIDFQQNVNSTREGKSF